jgi:hypothetical protein
MSTVTKDRQRRLRPQGYLKEPAEPSELERRMYCQCERPNVVKPRPLRITGFEAPPESPTCLKCGRTWRAPKEGKS